MKKSRKILVCIIAVFLTILASFFVYVSNYYHALLEAETYLCSEKNISIVTLKNGDICFVPASSQEGIIFYPGGKVDYKAYAPLINYQDGDYMRSLKQSHYFFNVFAFCCPACGKSYDRVCIIVFFPKAESNVSRQFFQC